MIERFGFVFEFSPRLKKLQAINSEEKEGENKMEETSIIETV